MKQEGAAVLALVLMSYEYEKADRAEQYYGSMHWDTAWPFLVKKLGR